MAINKTRKKAAGKPSAKNRSVISAARKEYDLLIKKAEQIGIENPRNLKKDVLIKLLADLTQSSVKITSISSKSEGLHTLKEVAEIIAGKLEAAHTEIRTKSELYSFLYGALPKGVATKIIPIKRDGPNEFCRIVLIGDGGEKVIIPLVGGGRMLRP